MKQYSVRQMQRILHDNGFTLSRSHSSHQIWKRNGLTVTLPSINLHSVIALRLIKENNLKVR